MLRRIDRVLAPLTWLAAALTVLVLLVGPGLIGADKPAGDAAARAGGAQAEAVAAVDAKAVFTSTCGGCHTLAAAGTSGRIGPDLDAAAPEAAAVASIVRSGAGVMPSFDGKLSDPQIAAVAAFVAGDAPPGATPTATATATPTASPEATPTAPPAPRVTTHRAGRGPDGITTIAGRDALVTDARDGTIRRFDARTGDPAGSAAPVGRAPDNPVVEHGVTWVVLTGDDAVIRVVGDRRITIPVGDAPEELAIGGRSVWVANGGDDTVTQIDRSSGAVVRTVRVGGRPLGIAVGLGAVWVTSYDDDTLTVLDAATGARSGPAIPVGHQPRGVAVAAGGIWVANAGDGTVTRLDARTATEIGSPTPVGKDPRDLAVHGNALWVAAAGDDQVVRIDARSGEPGRPIDVGDDPIGIAVGRRAVWTANFRDGTLSRIRLR